MRSKSAAVTFLVLFTATGCHDHTMPPETPMPPNTVLLSEMMRDLSAKPGFTDALLKEIDGAQGTDKRGPTLLTDKLADELRKRILGKDWAGLDRFPGWTMREINPTVRVVGHFAGKSESLEATSSVHPGASPSSQRSFLDVGPYPLDLAQTISLDKPSTLPGFTTEGVVISLGDGVTRGDGPNALASEHSESQRLADVLNRLAANGLDGVRTFSARVPAQCATIGEVNSMPTNRSTRTGWQHTKCLTTADVSTPQDLIAALQASGHTVTVTDSRYFANFGHFHYNGQDVMMPFWVNSEIAVPGTGGLLKQPRPLLVPVSHAELEWHIRADPGSHGIDADVSFYFGIDGKAEWRTMDTLDQAWVLKRDAHTYSGDQVREVTRLTGLLAIAYMHQHAARPALPFGGYYALGVCQDGVSAVEKKMTGQVTLYPNTADTALFDDPRDAEVNAMIEAIPKDRSGAKPDPGRIFGSLPTSNFDDITIPGLAGDLRASYAAWQDGTLERTHGWAYYARMTALGALGLGAAIALIVKQRRR